MMLITFIDPSDRLGNSKRPDFLSLFHRVTCVFGVLITAYYLLMCISSFTSAMDDMRKYGGLGFSYSFPYYLIRNSFPKTMGMALPVTTEFLIYVMLCRGKDQKKSHRGEVTYFSILLVFHVVIWLYVNSLDFPESPPYITEEGVTIDYCVFASITMLQTVVYFVLYLLRVRKFQKEMDS